MTKRAAFVAAAVLAGFAFAWAHPAIEGGIKHGFAAVKGLYGSHIELVADPRAGELRLYVSEAQDEKQADGKNHEWVIPMTIRAKKVRDEDLALLPMRDPGPGKEWFPVAPVEASGGYVFYRIEATARVMLDGQEAKRSTVSFAAGTDPRGTRCLVAKVAGLGQARTLRLEEVKVSILDAKKARPAWEKACFTDGWGLNKLHKGLAQTDLPLSAFADSLAKSGTMDKFRKPQAPAAGLEKAGKRK